MQSIFIALLSILTIMDTSSQNITTDRQPYAAGRFYPADKKVLTADLAVLFKNCKKPAENWNVRAIISPHAGYIFSGRISASAFSAIPQNAKYKNIFIIGSSHVMYFDGASVYNCGDYLTPFGKAIVNKEIADKLISDNKVFKFPVDAHIKEHSIENQVPFIQYYFKDTPAIVPIIIGTDNEITIKKIAEALRPWFVPENLFIISSDFSHYPGYKDAVETDRLTANSIISGNSKIFLNALHSNESKRVPGLVTSMCGWTSGLTLLDLTEGNGNIKFKLVDYCNSGDSPDSLKNEVVGYNAIVVIDKSEIKTDVTQDPSDIAFTENEKNQLFKIVRNSIQSKLLDNKTFGMDEKSVTENLKKPMGAFVTLKINGSLRGCIGRFVSSEPLYKVVQESAISSAFDDPRFSPLTKDEYKKTDIEITVLGPLKKINNINEIVLGKHGIYIKKGHNSGTMLPQVAIENGWTVEQFLGVTSKEKAGLGWDGWKDADIYIYEGVVLEEKK